MWYNYLKRDQPYLRSYRTHNLWLDQYHEKIREHRIVNLFAIFRRMTKSYSGARVTAVVAGFTGVGLIKFFLSFKDPLPEDKKPAEIYSRLVSLYSKNKYGYHTRIMSDFDNLLEAALNERFIDDSTEYYDDPVFGSEIEDLQAGLNGDMTQSDIAHMMRDKDDGHASSRLCTSRPGKFGTNYDKTDSLSIYKVLPKGEKRPY